MPAGQGSGYENAPNAYVYAVKICHFESPPHDPASSTMSSIVVTTLTSISTYDGLSGLLHISLLLASEPSPAILSLSLLPQPNTEIPLLDLEDTPPATGPSRT